MTTTPVSESYIATVEECTAFLVKRAGTSAWPIAVTAGTAVQVLQDATAAIDAIPMCGRRYEIEHVVNGAQVDYDRDGLVQVLEFPRIIDGVTCDWDYGTQKPIVPQRIKDACCWEALAIVIFNSDTDRIERKTMQEDGVKSYSLGGDYSENLGPSISERQGGLKNKKAYQLLSRYILRSGVVR